MTVMVGSEVGHGETLEAPGSVHCCAVPPVRETDRVLLRVIAWFVVVALTLVGVTLLVSDDSPQLLGGFIVGTGVTWLVVDRIRRRPRRA